MEMNDLAPESVDLLQMVPENRRTNGSETPRSKTYESRRMRLYLVDDEEALHAQSCSVPASSQPSEVDPYELTGTPHVCHRCPEGGVYYNRTPRDPDSHSTHSLRCNNTTTTTADPDEGSVYFNYLQFANKGAPRTCTGTTNSTYEPITTASRDPTAAHAQNYAVFNCCKSKSLPVKKVSNGGCGVGGNPREEITYSVTGAGILNNNRAKKRKDWTRIKRLMFLVGILMGIIVALGGIVVGFVVLAPFNKKGKG